MSEAGDSTYEPIDRWVRESLDRSAQEVDAERILAGVRARLAQTPPRSGLRSLRRWGLRLAVAAALALAVFWGWSLWPRTVSAETLVEQVLIKEREQALDRCYFVSFQVDKGQLERDWLVPVQPQARLWTRGDRFFIESAKRPTFGAWGRDETGQVWVAPFAQLGARFDKDHVPSPLRQACDVFSMDVPTLLSEVLTHFELQRETAPRELVQILRAEPKHGHEPKTLRAARLEIDTQHNTLNRLVLTRSFKSVTVTTTFELAETRTQPDEHYRLENHLKKGALVLSGDWKLLQRLEQLRKLGKNPR